MRARVRLEVAAALLLGLTFVPAVAKADPATAEALFRDGQALMDARDFAKACSKFEDSEKQDPQLGTLLSLADCYAKAGRTASEWAAYNKLAFEAQKQGDSKRADAARRKASELEPNLSKLTINATDATTPGLMVRRDGEDIGTGALGSAIPVDPGQHVIEATAPGYDVWQTTVTLAPNRDAKAVLIPALAKKPEGAGAAAGGDGSSDGAATRRLIGFITGGVGVAGIGLGAVMGAVALSDKSSANSLCPNKQCSSGGSSKIDSASSAATVSTIGFIAGGVLAAGGVVLILTARPSSTEPAAPAPAPAARLVPTVGPQGGGLTLFGTF